jgi:hypothetical protein
MRFPPCLSKPFLLPALYALTLSCKPPASFPNCFEYLRENGFEHPLFAQIRDHEIIKNINDQLPFLLETLRMSNMTTKHDVTALFTIYLETGYSQSSQIVTIFVGHDGHGIIKHNKHLAYFYCKELPPFTQAAFKKSTIAVH